LERRCEVNEEPEALSADAEAFAVVILQLEAENERLKKLLYDTLGELTALRAANQMRSRIDTLKGEKE
jgi:hypothetical protein